MHKIKCIFFFTTILVSKTIYAQKDSSLTQIYFSFDSYKISEYSEKILKEICSNNSSTINYKIIGRTDKFGSFSYNDSLSLHRANSVFKYLVANGIDTKKISEINGYGKRKPLVNKTKINKTIDQTNRSVTIECIKKSVKESLSIIPVSNITIDTIENNKIVKSEIDRNTMDINSFQSQINSGTLNIILKNVNFVKGRHILLANSSHALNNVLAVMKKNESLMVEIQGHICCLDSTEVDALDLDTFERSLSTNRAKAVYDYLVANGIKASRMTFKGYGSKKKLVFPELSEEDAEKNRRVELPIIKN